MFTTHCNTLQHTATNCNTLQHTATHCNTLQHTTTHYNASQHTATHHNTLQHTTTHYNTLQHTTKQCNTHCNTLKHTHCNTLQRTAAQCNSLQHAATQHLNSRGTARKSNRQGLDIPCRICVCVAVCCSVLQCVPCHIYVCVAVCCSVLQCVPYRICDCVAVCCSVLQCVSCRICTSTVEARDTGWQRLIGSPKLQIIFHKRATKYRSLLRKMTYKDKGSYESSPPCTPRLVSPSCPVAVETRVQSCIVAATYCNILQHTATHCNTLLRERECSHACSLQHSVT